MSSAVGAIKPGMAIISGIRAGKATDRAAGHQVSGNQAAQAQLQPYMDTGKQANTMIQNQLSSGQLGGTFAPGDLTKDPGYQFALQQGEQALGRKQSAGGNFFSGQALKEAQQYGQGLADQTYNDAYNRWLQQQKNTYDILSGQSAQGLAAGDKYGGYSTAIGDIGANRVVAKENQRMKIMSDIFSGLRMK